MVTGKKIVSHKWSPENKLYLKKWFTRKKIADEGIWLATMFSYTVHLHCSGSVRCTVHSTARTTKAIYQTKLFQWCGWRWDETEEIKGCIGVKVTEESQSNWGNWYLYFWRKKEELKHKSTGIGNRVCGIQRRHRKILSMWKKEFEDILNVFSDWKFQEEVKN